MHIHDSYTYKEATFREFEFEFLVFNATFSNISAISWRPVLVVRTTDHGKATDKFLSLVAASRVHPFL